jgi:hypothetical protein
MRVNELNSFPEGEQRKKTMEKDLSSATNSNRRVRTRTHGGVAGVGG